MIKLLYLFILTSSLPMVTYAQFELQLSTGPTGMSFLDDRPFRISTTNITHDTERGVANDLIIWQTFFQLVNIELENTTRKMGVRLSALEFFNDRSPILSFQPWTLNKFVREEYLQFSLQSYLKNKPYAWLRLKYLLGFSFRHGVECFASNVYPRYHFLDQEYRANDFALNPGITAELLLPYNFTLALHQNYHYFFKMKDPNSPRHTYVANATLGYRIQFKNKPPRP